MSRKTREIQVPVPAVILLFIIGCGLVFLFYRETVLKARTERSDPGSVGRLPTLVWEGKTLVQRKDVQTLLLIGVDATDQTSRVTNRSGGQADFLVLLVFDSRAKEIRQMHIDRDTMTNVRYSSLFGETWKRDLLQICLSHGYGKSEQECCDNTVDAVQHLFPGMRVNGYLSVNRDQIGVINDYLGGITVTVEDDDLVPLDPALRSGATLRLNAKQAEIFTRTRISVGDGTNVSRMRRQETFMRGLVKAIRENVGPEGGGANDLFLKLESCVTTNLSRGWYVNLASRAGDWKLADPETLAGEHTVGADQFVEFYPYEGEITRWMAETLYE